MSEIGKTTMELLRAGTDASGSTFTRECLERMVKHFEHRKECVLVTKGFSGRLTDTQGVVDRLFMQGDSLMADITLLDTPEGEKAADVLTHPVAGDRMELAAGGHVLRSSAFSIEGHGPRTITEFDLKHTALVTDKVK